MQLKQSIYNLFYLGEAARRKERYINQQKLLNGNTMIKIREPTSKFIKIRCPKCKNEQITFGKTATKVDCLVCGKTLAEPTGGKSRVKARILEVLD